MKLPFMSKSEKTKPSDNSLAIFEAAQRRPEIVSKAGIVNGDTAAVVFEKIMRAVAEMPPET